MKRALAIAIVFITWTARAGVPGWSVDTWTLSDHSNTVNIYHQRIANDVLSNTLMRARVLLDPDWRIVNLVDGIAVTNQFGLYADPASGTSVYVRLNRDSLESITDEIETLLPSYSLPYYASDSECGFDTWFANGLSEFPMADKPDLFHKAGIGGLLVYSNGLPHLPFAANTDQALNEWGQVTNTAAFWGKRKGRASNLILGRWGPETVPIVDGYYWGGWTNHYPALQINTFPPFVAANDPQSAVTEFYNAGAGESRLIDVLTNDFPVFVWIPGRSASVFPGELQLSHDTDIGAGSSAWFDGNRLTNNSGDFSGVIQSITSPTSRADRAWVSTRLIMDGGSSNDHVILRWTNTMNTYEGTKAWDNVLLPEQFDEHYVALTNLFLTPWTYWTWADSVYATNTVGIDVTNMVTLGAHSPAQDHAMFFTPYSDSGVWTGTCIYPTPYPNSLAWWLKEPPAPWFTVTVPDINATTLSGEVPLGVAEAPRFTYDLAVSVDVAEGFNATAWSDYATNVWESTAYNPIVWTWGANKTVNYSGGLEGTSVRSKACAFNLSTEVPHRMHVYARYNFSQASGSEFFHRVEIVPASGFSLDDTLCSSVFDLTTNVAGFVVEPAATNLVSSGCGSTGLIASVDRLYITNEIAPVVVCTNSVVGTNSWLTGVTSGTTGEYALVGGRYERAIEYRTDTTGYVEWAAACSASNAVDWHIYAETRQWTTTNAAGVPVEHSYVCPHDYVMVGETNLHPGTSFDGETVTDWIGPVTSERFEQTIEGVDYVSLLSNYYRTNVADSVSASNTVATARPDLVTYVDDCFGSAINWASWWPTVTETQTVCGVIQCNPTGYVNHDYAAQSNRNTVALNTNFNNTMDVRILIEWDH